MFLSLGDGCVCCQWYASLDFHNSFCRCHSRLFFNAFLKTFFAEETPMPNYLFTTLWCRDVLGFSGAERSNPLTFLLQKNRNPLTVMNIPVVERWDSWQTAQSESTKAVSFDWEKNLYRTVLYFFRDIYQTARFFNDTGSFLRSYSCFDT